MKKIIAFNYKKQLVGSISKSACSGFGSFVAIAFSFSSNGGIFTGCGKMATKWCGSYLAQATLIATKNFHYVSDQVA